MEKNTVEPDRPQMTIRRMGFTCWISKATNTYSNYVIFILFFLKRFIAQKISSIHLVTKDYKNCSLNQFALVVARNIYFLSMATMVSRTRFNITFILTLPVLLYTQILKAIPRKYSCVRTCTRDSPYVVTLFGYCRVWSRIPKLNSWSSLTRPWRGRGNIRGAQDRSTSTPS
jgi:hypothetical protein